MPLGARLVSLIVTLCALWSCGEAPQEPITLSTLTTLNEDLLRAAGEATAYADSHRFKEAENAWTTAHGQFHAGLEPAMRTTDDPTLLELEYTFARFHQQLTTRRGKPAPMQIELERKISAAMERLKGVARL